MISTMHSTSVPVYMQAAHDLICSSIAISSKYIICHNSSFRNLTLGQPSIASEFCNKVNYSMSNNSTFMQQVVPQMKDFCYALQSGICLCALCISHETNCVKIRICILYAHICTCMFYFIFIQLSRFRSLPLGIPSVQMFFFSLKMILFFNFQ